MKIEKLLERFLQGDEEARDQLRGMGEKAVPALPTLSDALRSDRRPLRLDAMFVLEGLGPLARPAIPALLEALREDDPEMAMAAADTLGVVGEDAVPGLIEALKSDQPVVRQGACQALGLIGPAAADAVPALIERVGDKAEKEGVACRAVWALGHIGDEAALVPLAEILGEVTGSLACWIAEVFGQFARRAHPVAHALRDELHRDDIDLALAAAAALIRMRIHEEAAVWALISCLQRGDDDARIEAAMLLGECGSKASAAIASLLAAERDENDELRAQAAISIAKIRPEYATHA